MQAGYTSLLYPANIGVGLSGRPSYRKPKHFPWRGAWTDSDLKEEITREKILPRYHYA